MCKALLAIVRTGPFAQNERGSHWRVLSGQVTRSSFHFGRIHLSAVLNEDWGSMGGQVQQGEAGRPVKRLSFRQELRVVWSKVRTVEVVRGIEFWIYFEHRTNGFADDLDVYVGKRIQDILRYCACEAGRKELSSLDWGRLQRSRFGWWKRDVGTHQEVRVEHVRFEMSFQHPLASWLSESGILVQAGVFSIPMSSEAVRPDEIIKEWAGRGEQSSED